MKIWRKNWLESILNHFFKISVIRISLKLICLKADEVHLKNGDTWINVKVVDFSPSKMNISLFTSMGKTIFVLRDSVSQIKKKKYNPHKDSECLSAEEYVYDYEAGDNESILYSIFAKDKIKINGEEITLDKENPLDLGRYDFNFGLVFNF